MSFFLLLSTILIAAWIYIWRRLIVSARLPSKWQRLAGFLFFALLILQIVVPAILRSRMHAGKAAPPFAFSLSFGILGFIDILLFATLVKDLIYLFARKSVRHASGDSSRRLFLTRSLNIAALTAATGATAIGTSTALAMPELKRVRVPVRNLHPDLEGLTIAQISDLHVGNMIGEEKVRFVVDTINSLKPDIIVLTGDIADGSVEALVKQTQPLTDLKAPLGKFYVTGNHEYYWDVDEWIERAGRLGFDYLYNTHRMINVKSARLHVGGVADYMCTRVRPDHVSDPTASVANAAPSDYKILLAHQPKSCFLAYKAGYDLQLSGHTHCGQFFPNSLFIRFFHPYYRGLNLHENKMWVYVSVGTGFWGPPQRLGIPAEITLLTLTKA